MYKVTIVYMNNSTILTIYHLMSYHMNLLSTIKFCLLVFPDTITHYYATESMLF